MKNNLSDLSCHQKVFTFSIGVTGRCNASCSYCHYYANRNKKSVAYDIPTSQFLAYMNFINYWREKVEGITSYRFSGGDPIVLGDRLFDLANMGFNMTGMKPFVLTAGKGLNRKWVDKAVSSNISHVFVSIENPFNPNQGAPNPFRIVDSIRKLNTKELPVIPGVCVIPNESYKDLYRICKWFYDELGEIPLISEVNYSTYMAPSDYEWKALEENLDQVINEFSLKTNLNLFSSVAPEYAYGGKDPYVFDLDLGNTHGITKFNFETKLDSFIENLKTVNYPKLNCVNTECPWYENCRNVKWYWKDNIGTCIGDKINDYCRFKRLVSDSFYRNLVDPRHEDTSCKITL